jgi:hypothetical protein
MNKEQGTILSRRFEEEQNKISKKGLSKTIEI